MTTLASGVPVNAFKQAISQRASQRAFLRDFQSDSQPDSQIGLWLATGDAYVAEMVAGTGFDWLLIDGEHAPNDLRGTLAQLQAIASASSTLPAKVTAPHPVVRLPTADPVLVKQYLELGVQTLLLPMIDTPEQAESMAKAMRYPPMGSRGIGCGLARSSRWNRFSNYLQEANDQVCLLVQVETVEALGNIDAIAATPGVDGVFIGPADLSASMGYLGQPAHPEVVAAIQKAVQRIAAAGKPSGILATNEAQAHQWLKAGVSFAAVGVDISLLSMAAQGLASRFKQTSAPVVSRSGY